MQNGQDRMSKANPNKAKKDMVRCHMWQDKARHKARQEKIMCDETRQAKARQVKKRQGGTQQDAMRQDTTRPLFVNTIHNAVVARVGQFQSHTAITVNE